jgi:hypothetical protein
MIRTLLTISILGLAAIATADARDFAVEVNSIFQGTSLWPTAPLSIDIENKGPDAKGAVLVGNEMSSVTRYPIDLPRGAKKHLVVYPQGNNYGGTPDLYLDTDRGRMQLSLPNNRSSYAYGGSTVVALVSDNPGEMAFLRQSTRGGETERGGNLSYFDCYVKPEDAPDRPVGFTGCAGVVLGSGSDRLSDAAVKAIQLYALTGGTVMFVGGAGATVLEDKRWSSILPVHNFKTATVHSSAYLNGLVDAPLSESFSVAAGTADPGAKTKSEGGIPMVVERPVGIGKVVFLAFDPFENPLARWGGRTRLFVTLIRSADFVRSSQFLSQFAMPNSYDGYTYSATPVRTSPFGSPVASSPFDVKLPPPSKVFWTLVAFFIVVVPVNFFVLRKIVKRAELAWVTSPLISLAFAGVFLNQASDLYSAALSTATNGVLIVQDGLPTSLFVGQTQIFFPNGGNYDLKLENVDQLGTGTEYDYYGSSNRTSIDPVDVGTVKVPSLRAANLAFEQISYRQLMPSTLKIEFRSMGHSPNGDVIKILNRGGESLSSVGLLAHGNRFPIASLPAGGEATVTVPTAVNRDDNSGDALQMMTRTYEVAILVATIHGVTPGPQIGKNVADRTNVRLAYVSNPGVLGGGR